MTTGSGVAMHTAHAAAGGEDRNRNGFLRPVRSPASGGTPTVTAAWPGRAQQTDRGGCPAAAAALPPSSLRTHPALGSKAVEGMQARRRQPTPATRRARTISGQPSARVGVEGASLGRAHVDAGCSSPRATTQFGALAAVTDDGVNGGAARDAGVARSSRHRVVHANDDERACRGEARHPRNGRGTRGALVSFTWSCGQRLRWGRPCRSRR